MQAFIAGGKITSSGGGKSGLPVDLHTSAKPIAIAAGATKCNHQPMQFTATIEKHLRVAAESGHHDILPPIIIKVSESRAPRSRRNCATRIDALEACVVIHRD